MFQQAKVLFIAAVLLLFSGGYSHADSLKYFGIDANFTLNTFTDYGLDQSFWPSSCSKTQLTCQTSTDGPFHFHASDPIILPDYLYIGEEFHVYHDMGEYGGASADISYLGDGKWHGDYFTYDVGPGLYFGEGIGITQTGSTNNFTVIQDVPELSTWAYFLIGFFAIGLHMRQRNSLAFRFRRYIA